MKSLFKRRVGACLGLSLAGALLPATLLAADRSPASGASEAVSRTAPARHHSTENRRTGWVIPPFVGSGVFSSAGIACLLIRSDREQGFEIAYPSTAELRAHVNIGFVPTQAGGSLRLFGTF